MKPLVVLAALLTACTTLGPMPATTGVSAVPAGRPQIELQGGAVPAFWLSQAAQDEPRGEATQTAMLTVEPDRWLGTHGLIAGVRAFGKGPDTLTEPYIGFRRQLDDDVSIAVVGFGTETNGTGGNATYHAERLGGELAVDLRAFHPWSWLEGHVQGSVQAAHIDATGHYCAADGLAVDCDGDGSDHYIDGTLHGTFPSATGTFALAIAPSSTRWFAGARLAIMFATGRMPLIVDGKQDGTGVYYSGGLAFSLAFGGSR
jgi:hypothetical protein